jgi:hypothetical protein
MMTEFEKQLAELLEGAKTNKDFHEESKKAYADILKSGTALKKALGKLTEISSKYGSK